MFTIRVYGILMDNNGAILVSDELIRGKRYTKFCGGGLEFGEGMRDCLKREFKEEMDAEIEVLDHLYTTDFFVRSAFDNKQQVVSIYYNIKLVSGDHIEHRDTPYTKDDFDNKVVLNEAFRFVSRSSFSAEHMTLPIDKVVATMIINSSS